MIKALLTIDDIASKNTPAIVDYLNEKGIKPIMFAVGEWVLNNYDEAVYALKHGMIVGNHSYSHPFFSELSEEQIIEEITKCEEVLDKLYADAGVERTFRPFRFPYGDKGGDKKDMIQNYLRENGFDKVDDTSINYPWWSENGLDKDIDTYWTYDCEEYRVRPGSDFTMDSVFEKMNNRDPEAGMVVFEDGRFHILLLHAHDETEEMCAEYYKKMIDNMLDNGVNFI